MIKIKDGYAKLIGTTYSGSVSRVLLSNGGDHILGNSNSNIPLNNGTVNANLNADMLDGLHIHAGRNNEVNKIVRTDASGYILAGWINTTSGDIGAGAINKIYCSNDNYIRYKTPANFFSTLANSGNDISITVAGLNRKLTVGYASNSDTVDGFHYNRFVYNITSRYNRNGPYYKKIASVNTANWTWASASLVLDIFSTGYSKSICYLGTVEITCGHWNNTDHDPSVTCRWILKVPNSKNQQVVAIKNLNTNTIDVYLLNDLWDCQIIFNVIYNNGFSILNISLTDGGFVNLPTASDTVIHYIPSNPTYIGNASTATTLQTAKTLWGQSFNGSNNVSGSLSNTGTITASAAATYDIGSNTLDYRYGYFQWIGAKSNTNLRLAANNSDNQIVLHTNGNVGIGTNAPTYKLHVNGTLGVNNIATFNINNSWLSPSVLLIGRLNDSKDASKAIIGVTNGNLHIDAYHNKGLYLNYYNKGRIILGYQTGSYYISEDGSYYNGTAASATNADKLDGIHANGLLTDLSNSDNGISITVGGTTKSVSNISVNYANSAGSAGSATKVIVNLHTANDTNYPLVWSNLSNTNSVTENQLYKSWSDLYYNPKNKRLTVGGSVVASSFVKSGGTSLQLLRADGGIATFNWSGQSGLPTWLWGGNNLHSYYVYNPSNFRVAYAKSSGNADTLDGVHLSEIFTAFGNNKHNITATIGGVTKEFLVNYATNADKLDGYHASDFVKIKLFRFSQYNQGTWTKILTITINSTTDLLPAIAFSWIPSECSRTIWADFSINWRSNSPIFYAIWKGMDSRTLKVVNSSGAIWDVWVSGNKNDWDPFGEIQVTYTHNITSYNGGSLGYSDTDPGGTICITGGLVNYATSATKLATARSIWGQSFDGTANVNGTIYINNSDSSNGAIRLNNDRNSNARISAISDQVIFNTGSAIRFGETDWDFNQWAGLKYTHSNKTIYLGIADNSIFNANSALSGGTLKFPGITTITTNPEARIGNSGGDLYLGNADNSNWVKVQDMCSQIDSDNWVIYQSGSAEFKDLTIYGDVSLCVEGGNVGIGTTSPSYKLDVNGLMRANGFIHSGHNSDDAVLLAGGGYKTLSDFTNNYYWANVKISDSSSTTTSPTVSNLTATSSIRMGNIYLQNTNEINSANGGLHLNYRNSGDVSLCAGGGNVSIGLGSSLSYKLDVNGDIRSLGTINCNALNVGKFIINGSYINTSTGAYFNLNGKTVMYYNSEAVNIDKRLNLLGIACLSGGLALYSSSPLDKRASTDTCSVLIGSIPNFTFTFYKGVDGLILFMKWGNASLDVRVEGGCEIIRSNDFYHKTSSYGDGKSRIFIYLASAVAWYEFYCG